MTNNKFVHQTNLPFSAHEINIFHSRIALYSIITELCVWTRNKIHLQIYKKWWTLCFLNQAKSMLTYKEALMGGSCLCGQFGQVPFPLPLLGLSGYMYTNIHNSHLYLNWVMSLGFIWLFLFNFQLRYNFTKTPRASHSDWYSLLYRRIMSFASQFLF